MLDFDFDGLRKRGEAIVYLLSDPRPDRLECYVGQTMSPARFSHHLKAPEWSTTKGKAAWIAELKALGTYFKIDVVEICSKENVTDRERFWIGRYEHSPHHILLNGFIDRGIFSETVPDESIVELLQRKPNYLARVAEFEEIWCYFMKPENVVAGFHPGYRLLRQKETVSCTQSEFELSTKRPPSEHWKQALGPKDYALMRRGITGMYTAQTAVPNGDLKVTLTDYVQWAVKTHLGYQTVEEYRVAFNDSSGKVPALTKSRVSQPLPSAPTP